MIRRIVIAYDFSKTSRCGIDFGLRLAEQVGGTVVFVTVLDVKDLRVAMRAGLHDFDTDGDIKRKVDEWVESNYAEIEKATKVEFKRVVCRGVAEKGIVDTAVSEKADLIVMGSSGMAQRVDIGSVTRSVMRLSSIPVAVVNAERTK